MKTRDQYLLNGKIIAAQLIAQETSEPGTVRMCQNHTLTARACAKLEGLGFKKKFFQSQEQFVYDAFLTHEKANGALRPFTLFSGRHLKEGGIPCWNAVGQFAGFQGLFQLNDFSSGGKQDILLIVNIEPFFESLSPFLDPVTR
jgi:hypothetical protein